MDERGRWITLNNGTHVFIRPGETVSSHFRGEHKLQKTVPDRFKHGKLNQELADKLARIAKENKIQAGEAKGEYLKQFDNDVFKDVTDDWKLEHEQKPISIEDDYVIIDGKKYKMLDPYIDGKPVKFGKGFTDITEKEDADILSRQIGGEIHKQPKIDYPLGRKNADYRREYNKDVMFLEQKHVDPSGSKDTTIWNAINNSKGQSKIQVVDLRYRQYTTEKILSEVKRVFKNQHTSYVETVIIIKDGKQIWKVFANNTKKATLR